MSPSFFSEQGQQSSSSSGSCMMERQQEKLAQIQRCLDQPNIDLWQLRELALTRGGLINSEMRQRAWPKLVGLDAPTTTTMTKEDPYTTTNSPEVDHCYHNDKEAELIRQEAGRSVLFRYQQTSGESSSPYEGRLAKVLQSTIDRPLTPQQGKIHYYQGLHDVAGVILYNLEGDVDQACAVLRKICQSHLRDALREDFRDLTWLLDTIFLPLLHAVNETVHTVLLQSQVEASNTILPWLITWFTHDIHNETVASRLVDAFLVSHPLFPLYFAVAVITHPHNQLELEETDWDPAEMHMSIRGLLSKLDLDWGSEGNEGTISVQELIDNTISLMREHPPRSLLNLANTYGDGSLTEDSSKERAMSVTLMKAPPSWALTSTVPSDGHGLLKQNETPRSPLIAPEKLEIRTFRPNGYSRAKIASGVGFLMSSIDKNIIFSKRTESSNTRNSTLSFSDRTSPWKWYHAILFSSDTAEKAFIPISAQ